MRPGISGYGLIALALIWAACGEEQTFTADEFVERVRDEGVAIELGESLITDDESKQLHTVELEQVVALEGSHGEGAAISGSLSVSEDADGAGSELEDCRAAADLLCYQAGNVVVVLQGGGIESQRLGAAMQRLADD